MEACSGSSEPISRGGSSDRTRGLTLLQGAEPAFAAADAAAGTGSGAARLPAAARCALRCSTSSRCACADWARASNFAVLSSSSAARRARSTAPLRVRGSLATSARALAGADGVDAEWFAARCAAPGSAASARASRAAALSSKVCLRRAAVSLRCASSSASSSDRRRVSTARCCLRAASTHGATRNRAWHARSCSASAAFAATRCESMRERSAVVSAASTGGARQVHPINHPSKATRAGDGRRVMLFTSATCPHRGAPWR